MAKYKTVGMIELSALAEELKAKGGQSEIARIFKAKGAPVLQASISSWCRGESRPTPVLRVVMRQLFGIAETAWLTKPEQRLLDRVAARASEDA